MWVVSLHSIDPCSVSAKPSSTTTKTGLFRRATATGRQLSAGASSKPSTTSNTTAPAIRTTKTSLTKPTASSAQKVSVKEKEKDDKPLPPQPPASKSSVNLREPPVPPKNVLPHPVRVTAPLAGKSETIRQRTSTAGSVPSTSSSGLGGAFRAQPAVGVNRINATGTGHVTGTRSISAGGTTVPKSPTAARMRASMTSGSISGAISQSKDAATVKKKEDGFVVPSASVRSTSIASTNRTGGTVVPGRVSSAGSTVGARSLVAKKNEMEIKVSPRLSKSELTRTF
jgi:hypothetical protein